MRQKLIHSSGLHYFKKIVESRFLWMILALFLLSNPAKATHIVGGNMYYTCQGNDMYEITFTMQRDCINGADDALFTQYIFLTVFDRNNQFCVRRGDNGYIRLELQSIDTLNADLEDFCIEEGDKVCVEEAVYKGVACLPKDELGFILAYQRCCRNGTLSNIEDPLNTGGTWMVEITPEAMEECNSNPVFNNRPPIYVCLNDDLIFDHSATDPDGDVLVYRLCTPTAGATRAEPAPTKASNPPYDSVVWRNPYNRLNMVGGTPPMRIDPNTGIITAHPELVGQYVVGIRVDEYRNGVLIGWTKRDFEINVRPCGEKPEAGIDVLTEPCDGLMQMFSSTSVGATSFKWFFDYPNRTPFSDEENPKHTYSEPGKYRVVLVVENDEGCKDSTFVDIEVFDPQLEPDFEYEIECEPELKIILTDKSTSNDSIVKWSWEVDYPGGQLTSMERNPMFILPKGGTVTIRLTITDKNGCEETKEITDEIDTINVDLVAEDAEICFGEEIKLIVDADTSYTYTWSPLIGLKLDDKSCPKACPIEDTKYCVTITNEYCTKMACIDITVKDTIPVKITGEDTTCTGEVVLVAMSDFTHIFEWSKDPNFIDIIGTGDTLRYEIMETCKFYVRAGSEDDCRGEACFTVTYIDAIDEDIDRVQEICFGPGMIQLNPGGNEDYEYRWSPGQVLDDSTIANPKATITMTTKFSVTITNPEYPDCPEVIEVIVRVGEDLRAVNLPEDTIICEGEPFDFTVITVPEDVEVSWCDSSGNVIGQGKTIRIDPNDEIDVYIVKITDSLGCTARDTMRIEVYQLDIEIEAPDSICNGDTVKLTIINNGTDSLSIVWSPEDEIIGTNIGPMIMVAPSEDMTYTATIDNGKGCIWERTVTVNVGGFDLPLDVTADPTKVILGQSTMLDVDVSGNIIYMWTGPGLDDPNIRNPKGTPTEPGMLTYTVKVTDEEGCMATGSVTIEVCEPECIEGVTVPNAFSPNNDMQNDILYVRSLYIETMEFYVVNRWGETVFRSNNIADGWDGTYKGEQLPPDVYGYVLKYLCVDQENYVKKGNVTLLR